jgi:dCMP deaminase
MVTPTKDVPYGLRETNCHWDVRFMRLAHEVAGWSKDPSRKIGAVITRDRRVLCTGYNGFPMGIADSIEALADREYKYRNIIHGEMNAIFNASREGISLEGSTLYVTTLPCCPECAKGIVQSGIRRVVMEHKSFSNPNDPWYVAFAQSLYMFSACHLCVEIVVDNIDQSE